MFGLFKKRSLSDQEIAERAESCLGELLKQNGPNGFAQLVGIGYLGFTPNSVYYSAGLRFMKDDTISYVKLSDIPMPKTIRPAVLGDSGWMIPQEIVVASVLIAGLVKPWNG